MTRLKSRVLGSGCSEINQAQAMTNPRKKERTDNHPPSNPGSQITEPDWDNNTSKEDMRSESVLSDQHCLKDSGRSC